MKEEPHTSKKKDAARPVTNWRSSKVRASRPTWDNTALSQHSTPGSANGVANNMPHMPEHDLQQSPVALCCNSAVLSQVGREARTFDERQFVPGRAASFASDVCGSSFTA